jgi:hypothetical protein
MSAKGANMSLKVHECRRDAAECENRGGTTSDPELKQQFQSLAKQWRAVAIQIEQLESEMEKLKARQN